jgi:streptogramin lyase
MLRALSPVIVVVLALGSPAHAGAAPAPGAAEEFPVETGGRWSLADLAQGPEGSIWFSQGELYEAGEAFASGTVERMTTSGALNGQLRLPEDRDGIDVALGPDGHMWILEEAGKGGELDGIARLSSAFEPEYISIPSTTGCCIHRYPVAITAGPGGAMWFTDQRPGTAGKAFIGRVGAMASPSVSEYPIPTGSASDLPVESEPVGIALGAEGDLWFTDQGQTASGHNLIGRISTTGAITEYPVPQVGAEPTAVAAGSDGNIWFSEPGVEAIGRITPAGTIAEYPAPSISFAKRAIMLGPDGNIWFSQHLTEPGSPTGLASITPTGLVREYPLELHPEGGEGTGTPSNLGLGPEGDIWFTDQHFAREGGLTYLGRFGVPFVPSPAVPPVIAGNLQSGSVLQASVGTWQGAPERFSFQWQRCDAAGGDCQSIPGAVTSSYLLGGGDVASTLRVLVTAEDLAGAATVVSAVTAAIAPAPPVPPRVVIVRVVGATITVRFAHRGGRALARVLVLSGLTRSMLIRTVCAGTGCRFDTGRVARSKGPVCTRRGCSYTRAADGTSLDLDRLLSSARLTPGSRLTIVVTAPGQIGKAFTLVVRAHGQPTPHVSCRSVGSFTEVHEC